MLEAFASEREVVASELQELNAKIQKLENEKVERSESRKRFEKVKKHPGKFAAGPENLIKFHFRNSKQLKNRGVLRLANFSPPSVDSKMKIEDFRKRLPAMPHHPLQIHPINFKMRTFFSFRNSRSKSISSDVS